MKNIYKIYWSKHALAELKEVYTYLETAWTFQELKNLALKIEKTISFISGNPELYPRIAKDNQVRRVVVTKHNILYYRVYKQNIEIISFFTTSKNPNKLKL